MIKEDHSIAMLHEENAHLRQRVAELEQVKVHLQHTKEELRRSEARYRAIAEDHSILICRWKPDTMLTFVNDTYCRYFGKSREELIGHTFLDLVPEDEAQSILADLRAQNGHYQAQSKEQPVIAASGEVRWQKWSDQPIFDDDGQMIEYQSIGHDITELRALKTRLRETREQLERRTTQETEKERQNAALLQGILDYAPIAIYVKDVHGTFLTVNRTAARLMYSSPEEIIGKNETDIAPPEIVAEWRAHKQLVYQRREPIELEEVFPQEDGLHTYLSFRFPIFNEQGELYAVGGITTDITERKRAEQALHMFKMLVEHTPDGVGVTDLDGTITYANPAFKEMLQYGDDVVGEIVPTFLNESPEYIMALVQQIAEEGAWQGDLSYQRKDGTTFPAHLHAFAIRDEQGEIPALAGILRDITERKRTEQVLHMFKMLVEHTPDGVGVTTLDGTITYANPAYGEMTQYGDELVGSVLTDSYDESPDYIMALVQQVAEEGSWQGELSYKRKDGTTFPAHLHAFAIRDEQGGTQAVAGILRDITDRKEAEEELRHNQAFLQSMLDHIPAVIFIKDLDGYYQLINSFGLKASQLEREQVLYKRAADFLSADIADEWRTRELEVISSGRAVQSEDTLETDQSTKTFFTVTFPIFNANQSIIATGGIAIDITDRKRAEHDLRRSKERLRSLSRQLVMVQEEERRALARELHDEVGQALTAVKLTMGKVADIADAQVASRLENARAIVNDLMAQVRNLSLKLRPPMLDDMGLLSTLEWHFERYTDQTQVQVHFEHQGIEKRLPSDIEIAIYRIVQEALTNVARYAGVEEVTVHISADQREIQVEIHDQGCGFDYHKVHATSSGLLGMRERIGLLGGKFWVDTAPGEGTRIQVEVPLDTSSSEIADG